MNLVNSAINFYRNNKVCIINRLQYIKQCKYYKTFTTLHPKGKAQSYTYGKSETALNRAIIYELCKDTLILFKVHISLSGIFTLPLLHSNSEYLLTR